MNAPAVTWTVERTASRRFPYRVAIEQGGRLVAAFRTQAAWPGPGQQILCLREEAVDPDEPLQPLEHVPVLGVTRLGRKDAGARPPQPEALRVPDHPKAPA